MQQISTQNYSSRKIVKSSCTYTHIMSVLFLSRVLLRCITKRRRRRKVDVYYSFAFLLSRCGMRFVGGWTGCTRLCERLIIVTTAIGIEWDAQVGRGRELLYLSSLVYALCIPFVGVYIVARRIRWEKKNNNNNNKSSIIRYVSLERYYIIISYICAIAFPPPPVRPRRTSPWRSRERPLSLSLFVSIFSFKSCWFYLLRWTVGGGGDGGGCGLSLFHSWLRNLCGQKIRKKMDYHLGSLGYSVDV